jgi:histidinol-phosphate aminotransferase
MLNNIIKKNILNDTLIRPFGWDSTPRDTGKLWLDKNENTDPVYNKLVYEISKSIDKKFLWSYPEAASLYNKLSKLDEISVNNLILTYGSDGGIKSTFELLINPGDKVLITNPTFAMYEIYCKIYGAKIHKIEYDFNENGPLILFEDLCSDIKKLKPKLFCLPNPDSPTGSVFSNDEIIKLIDLCYNESVVLLIDEAYYPYYDNTFSSFTLKYTNLIITRTFSKAWGLAGLRLGYIIAHTELIRYLNKIKPMYEIGSYSIAFIEKALDYYDDMKKSVNRINTGKDFFIKKMISNNLPVYKNEGNFLHVSFNNLSNTIHSELEKVVLYRKDFDFNCLKGYSRFTSTTQDNFIPIIKIIEENINK